MTYEHEIKVEASVSGDSGVLYSGMSSHEHFLEGSQLQFLRQLSYIKVHVRIGLLSMYKENMERYHHNSQPLIVYLNSCS